MKTVLMDSRRVEVMAFSTLRWRGVRADDPRADLYFLHHRQLLAALLLPSFLYEGQLRDCGSEVHPHPPAGLERHYTSRSAAAYGAKAGTGLHPGLTLYDNEVMGRCLISI